MPNAIMAIAYWLSSINTIMHTFIAGFRKQSFLALMLAFATVAQIAAPSFAYAVVINPEPEQPIDYAATVQATKIVCPKESDLPNWGAGGPDITATTTAEFLKNNPQCKTVQNWQFEWGLDGVPDPGATHTGPAGGVWKPFSTPTDTNGVATAYVPLNKEASRFWFREVLQPGYIPFTYPANDPVSAEFYCNNDVMNYDNYEWIDMPGIPKKLQGNPKSAIGWLPPTYHCVAFNVKKPVENTCSVPNTLGSVQPFDLGISPETPLATIFAANGIALDPVLDQKNFQKWDVAAGTVSVSMDVELLAKHAGNNQVFGYYLNGNPASFVPVFRVGVPASSTYASLPEATVGVPFPVTISGLSGTPSFGFALNTSNSASERVYFTEVLMNPGETPRDHAAVYNPAPNTYVVAFEDQPIPGADRDFNDLVVRVKNVRCTACENQNGVAISGTSDIVKVVQIGSNTATNPNTPAVEVTPTPITNQFWTADDAPADFAGAKWIWSEDSVQDWTTDKYVTFERKINVSGPATNAKLLIAADNSYEAFINGNAVGTGGTVSGDGHIAPPEEFSVTLNPGQNVLTVKVKNWAQAGEAVNNPAGLIYKLTWTVQCGGGPVDPGTAKVFIRKNVDGIAAAFTGSTAPSFPFKLGAGSLVVDNSLSVANNYSYTSASIAKYGSPVTVTEVTGTSPESIVLPKDAQCAPGKYRLVGYTTGTSFEDAQAKASNPANIVTDANINIGTLSADAYVIIWNEDCKLSTVTACKYEQTEDSRTGISLPGWTLVLLGSTTPVQSGLPVPANLFAGVMSTSLTAGTSYVANAVGTWRNGSNDIADAEYYQANGQNNPSAPWVEQYPAAASSDIHELRIANQTGSWGTYSPTNSYWRAFSPSVTGPVNFGIFDGENDTQNPGWFGDNSGTLTVDIYKGYAGVTGKDGCVTWANVPYGTYTLDEQLQDGWRKVRGTGSVAIDSTTENFAVVNARIIDECEGRECDGGPVEPTTGAVLVKTVVVNNNGGTKVSGDFTQSITGTSPSVSSIIGSEAGTSVVLGAGAYTVTDSTAVLGSYTVIFSADCVSTVSLGDTKTCTVTYDDVDTTTPGGPTTTSTGGGGDSSGNRLRRSGSVLGASTSIPEGEVLGASTELPGLPNTGTAPLNNTTEAVTLLAMIIALAGVNLIALRSDRKEA
jgi:hypothetical protein